MADLISTTIILLTVTLFLIGILIGWIMSNYAELTTDSTLKTIVAVVITIGWLTATISGILIASYTVSPLLHALMGGIVGYFFTDEGVNFNIGSQK